MADSPGSEPTRRALATVDLGAVERNCNRLSAGLKDGAELCVVVKADGYGHGAAECARAALDGGATRLAVATADEAASLRIEFPTARILIMGALTVAELDLALDADADVAVWRAGFLDLVAARGGEVGRRPRVHVKYDTGMGRLGARDPGEVRALAERTSADDRVELTGLWTHFATADDFDSPFFDEQLARFTRVVEEMRDLHPDLIVHAANSAAALRDPESHFDMVRCGVAIYGLDPFRGDPAGSGLEPAMSLRSYVADVKPIAAGESVGYGQGWRAERPTTVGVVPIGYGDGVRRLLSNRIRVLAGGAGYPVVGTISMDNLTVDLGPDPEVSVGDEVVLIGVQDGNRLLCEEMAAAAETINYEITCGISARVPRSYVGR